MGVILTSRVEVSYCTSGLFRSQGHKAVLLSVSCLSHVDLNHGESAVNNVIMISSADCTE